MTQRAPGVRYVTTSDGVSIACWSMGDGPPIVITHNYSLSHAELEWELPSLRRFFSALSSAFRVTRFDPRMAGISDRTAPSLSLDAMCLDIDAVADGFGYDSFALMGISTMGPVAVAYAASRPGRVSSLVLCDPDLVPSKSAHAQEIRGSIALTEAAGPDFAMEVFAARWFEPDEVEVARKIAAAAYGRTAGTSPVMGWDATPSLGGVRAPTLVATSTSSTFADLEQARQIAAGISGARLVRIEGRFAPYNVDQPAVLAAIGEHLGEEILGLPTKPTGLQAVVFTDVVDSTEYTNIVGDAAARAEVGRIESLVDERAAAHSGRVVKHLGDGSMLVFDSPTSAVDFALEVLSDLERLDLALRIGLAVGEPIEEDGDLHGAVVNLASRVAAEATPGRVFVSDATRHLLIGKSYTFVHVGSRHVKGFEDSIGLYEVVGRG